MRTAVAGAADFLTVDNGAQIRLAGCGVAERLGTMQQIAAGGLQLGAVADQWGAGLAVPDLQSEVGM